MMQFNLVDNNYISVLNDIPRYVDINILKRGGVYAGSYVLSILHPGMFDTNNVDIYFDREYDQKGNFLYIGSSVVRTIKEIVVDNIKFNYISTSISFNRIILNLQHYFDLDKSASRIYYNRDKDVIELAVPANIDMDPLSLNMYWNYEFIINQSQSCAKGHKYASRGFKVEGYGDGNPECIICHSFRVEILFDTRCCSNKYHKSCMSKWTKCDQGEELTENKCKCPVCRTFIVHLSYPLLYAIDFKKWAIIKCAICETLFPHERVSIPCYEDNTNPLICVECSLTFNPDIIIPGERFKCPNCLNVSEFRGGCQQLTCCIYGTDKCRDGCTHGGLCGHKWEYKKE
jgi:hypothetical protein